MPQVTRPCQVNRVVDALAETGSIGVLILDACRTPQLPGWPKPKGCLICYTAQLLTSALVAVPCLCSGGQRGLAQIESSGLYVAYAASPGQEITMTITAMHLHNLVSSGLHTCM